MSSHYPPEVLEQFAREATEDILDRCGVCEHLYDSDVGSCCESGLTDDQVALARIANEEMWRFVQKEGMMKVESILVARWNTFRHKDLMEEGFNFFGYGDSADTLMWPADLISELESWEDKKLEPLIMELNQVPPGALVSFEC